VIQPSVRSAAAAASTLVVALVAASAAAAWQLPAEVAGPRPAGRVVDTTGRLTADERREITALLDGIASQTRGDMMVVVIPTTAGVPHRQFATELFNRWRLGSAERDDGLLLFAALDDRRAEIILGDGLDDAARVAASQRVMDGVMIPEFKAGRPGGAIRRGALACAAEILGSRTESPAPDTSPATANDRGDLPAAARSVISDGAPSAEPSPVRSGDEGEGAALADVPVAVPDGLPAEPLWPRPARVPAVPAAPGPPWGTVAVLGGGLAATGVGGYGMWQFAMRRRRRACRRCHVPMIKLDELVDDARLAAAERTEELVGSVDYDVWTCPSCPLVEKLRYPAFFTRYARCPACKALTELTTTARLRSPTTSSEGLEEITESCRHCGRSVHFQRSIPRVAEPTSSSINWSSGSSGSSPSFGGGSSFGGGRSSGGGASGGW